jgi:type IV secretion system protein VirB4
MQYENAQAILFDLDGHGRLLTYLLGGYWHDLGAPGMRYAPLQGIGDPVRRALVREWLLDLLAEYGVPRDAITIGTVGSTLEALAERPKGDWTLSAYLGLMAQRSRESELHAKAGRIDGQGIAHQDPQLMDLVRRRGLIHQTLKMFTVGGEYDGLFDATQDDLTAHPVQTFEMRHLLGRASILAPVLRYVFLHVEQQMSTAAPMFLALDDAAVAWMADSMSQATSGMSGQRREEKVQSYLQTTAKKAVSVGFSTHSLVKVFGGSLGTLLQEACVTRFCMSNGAALEPDVYRIYQRLGYTDPAIQLIARAQPQRECYYSVRELGSALISFPLPRPVLDCLARNTVEDHLLMDRLLVDVGLEGFGPAWMAACGQHEAVAFLEQYPRTTHA